MTDIYEEIQKLDTSELVTMYEIDLTDIAPDLSGDDRFLRFAPMTNELGQSIVWGGKTYTPYPVFAEGFELNGQGSPPRPKLRAANLNGILSDLCLLYNDLVQAKLTRIVTFARFLDAVNFAAGNPDADSSQHKPLDVYEINQKSEENNIFIEWELRWSFDIQGVILPFRVIAQNICAWQYKGDGCEWVPVIGKYFDLNDNACSVGNDECSLSLTGCKKRFGAKASLPFGAFPGAGMVQQ